MHPLYDIVLKDIRTDATQMVEEGHDLDALNAEIDAAVAAGGMDALTALQEDFWSRPSPPGFPYDEPSDWETISAGFPDAKSHARFPGDEEELADRLHAAWLGRCAGCQLGKPLEGTTWPDKIETVLRTVGSWPLEDYMNPLPDGVDVDQLPDCDFFQRGFKNNFCKGRFDCVSPDDDIHYAIVSQRILEEHGTDFTREQAADMLVRLSPMSCLWASGRNLFRTRAFGVPVSHTGILGNPCRQSLGAQIRCDAFGWAAPANPALAASMAWRDAANSQVRNGIYSGIFFTVLMADSFAQGDPVKAVDTAQAYVPPKSRFGEMIRLVKRWCAAESDWRAVNRAVIERWPEESKKFNHSIPNAALVLMGLLKGDGDFTRTLGITVMGGLDTDCNGATVGSIMGCAHGTDAIPAHWTEPFNDTIRSEMKGMPQVRISEMARRMFELAKENTRYDR